MLPYGSLEWGAAAVSPRASYLTHPAVTSGATRDGEREARMRSITKVPCHYPDFGNLPSLTRGAENMLHIGGGETMGKQHQSLVAILTSEICHPLR